MKPTIEEIDDLWAKIRTYVMDLTYRAEGTDAQCCQIHHTVGGVTVGHGYDMWKRKPDAVRAHFKRAGIEAGWLLLACGLSGKQAKAFVDTNRHRITLTVPQMHALFEISAKGKLAELVRICRKVDTAKEYGAVDFDTLNPGLTALALDMIYRGDYTTETRANGLQAALAANDLEAVDSMLIPYWRGVPRDRSLRRKNLTTYLLSPMASQGYTRKGQ